MVSSSSSIMNEYNCHSYHPDPNMHETGHSDESMKAFSSIFVKLPPGGRSGGTRTNTVILVDSEGIVNFTERTMEEPINEDNPKWQTSSVTFNIEK